MYNLLVATNQEQIMKVRTRKTFLTRGAYNAGACAVIRHLQLQYCREAVRNGTI